jgi:hypothetical protein
MGARLAYKFEVMREVSKAARNEEIDVRRASLRMTSISKRLAWRPPSAAYGLLSTIDMARQSKPSFLISGE